MFRSPAGYIPLTMHELQGGNNHHNHNNNHNSNHNFRDNRDQDEGRAYLPSREKRGRRSSQDFEEREPREQRGSGERRPRRRQERERLSFSKPRDEEDGGQQNEIIIND